MPSVVSHYLLARRLISALKEQGIEEKFSQPALLWGAQGPDFLYAFSTQGEKNGIHALAKTIHQTPAADALAFLTDFALKSKNPIDTGYVLGFISHFAFDSIAHPFVLYACKKIAEDKGFGEGTCHNLIESNLDVILYRYETGRLINEIRLKSCVPKDDSVNQHMAVMYGFMAQQVYKTECNMDDILKAARDYRKAVNKLNDYTGLKKDYIARKERKKGVEPTRSVRIRSITEDDEYDYANIAGSSWQHENRLYTYTFMEMFEQADELTESMANAFFKGEPVAPLAQNKTFLG